MFGAIGIMVSAVIGAFVFERLSQLIPSNAVTVVPWVVISLFVPPLTLCVQLILKLWDLKEQDDISGEERRRLKSIITGKTRQFFIAIVYYVSSSVIVVILFVFFTHEAELFKIAIKITGILLGISMFSIYLILVEMNEISDFKAKLIERERSKKRQKSALKRLHVE